MSYEMRVAAIAGSRALFMFCGRVVLVGLLAPFAVSQSTALTTRSDLIQAADGHH